MTLLLIALLALPAVSHSEESGEPVRPCGMERDKFCKDVKPGGGAVMKCLRAHKQELSPSCRTLAEKTKEKVARKKQEIAEKMKAAKEACGHDVQALCGDVKPGGGAVVKCLRAHEGEITPRCRATLPPQRG